MNTLSMVWQYSPITFITFTLILALIIGSFLNMLIYRLPLILKRQWREDSQQFLEELSQQAPLPEGVFNLWLPRSQCPHCHTTIPFWHNIPVISWLVLRGHCHHCKAPIGWRYLFVELLSPVLIFSCFNHFGLSEQWFLACIFTLALLALAVIDLKTMLLPDQLTLPLLWLGLLINTQQTFVPLSQAVWGAAIGYVFLWLLYWGFKLLTHKEGMGYGDFKLLAAIGAWFGWQALPMTLLLSSILGALFGIVLLIKKHSNRHTPLPFGPFLAIGASIYLLAGNTITHWYGLLLGAVY
ncbi:MAG: Type 4 prepilin-like proteins leader peptide-processing enzyme [Candidatus Celerinatantimonas neptuna]|nr:MAG: Type 4 prepilin-like proteins leader peptide-processing enzyme [Candidatus Celerinatantimonas neptuna]